MKKLIKNVYVLTMDKDFNEYEKGYVTIENGKIEDVGHMKDISENIKDIEVIDGRDAILLPGMINCHTHTGMIPFRSLKEDVLDRLRRFFFPLEAFMTEEIIYNSAKYAVAEMQLGGVTTFSDMYYFEGAVAKATEEMKARALLGESVIDFPVCDSKEPFGGLKYSEGFIKEWKNNKLITPMIAPHAPYTNTKETLLKAREISEKDNLPIMIHICEMEFEIEKYKNEYNMTPIEYLDSIGFLYEKVIAAHCIFLTDKDIEILSKRGVKVAHCIGANTKSAKGVARVKDMLEGGIAVGLGTDGPSSGNTIDVVSQLRLFANCHKTALKDNTAFTSREVVELATIGGAKVLGLENQIGSIEKGKSADFILFETESVNMYPIHNPYSVIVYSANPSNIRDTYINGEAVVLDKKLVGHDLKDIRNKLEDSLGEFNKEAERLSNEVQ